MRTICCLENSQKFNNYHMIIGLKNSSQTQQLYAAVVGNYRTVLPGAEWGSKQYCTRKQFH